MLPDNFSEYFSSLNFSEHKAIVNELTQLNSTDTDDTFVILSKANSRKSTSCRHCHGVSIRANGKSSNGVQRYYCKDCKKYFRDTTGKVVFGLKKPALLAKHLGKFGKLILIQSYFRI